MDLQTLDLLLKYVFPILTFGLASVGCILGILNTWNSFERQNVKLRVSPGAGVWGPAQAPVILVEVTNMSPFTVTISEIGLRLRGHNKVITIGELTNGKMLPQRLEPRDSVTGMFFISDINPGLIVDAFTRTVCGVTKNGNSQALKNIRAGQSLLLREPE